MASFNTVRFEAALEAAGVPDWQARAIASELQRDHDELHRTVEKLSRAVERYQRDVDDLRRKVDELDGRVKKAESYQRNLAPNLLIIGSWLMILLIILFAPL